MKIRGLLLLIVITAGSVAGVVYWGCHEKPVDNPASKTARVVRRDFTSTVLATGTVEPQVGAEVRVGSRISGKVERLHANIGDQVEKGQVIAELEKRDLEATVDERKAESRMAEAKQSAVETLGPKEIEKAEADVAQCEATLELTRQEFARQDGLFKKEFSSQQARDQAQERLSVSQAQVAAARKTLELAKTGYTEDLKQTAADVERAKAALANAQVQLTYATITAPISGVIASVATQEGETVAAGLNAPTFVTIIDLSRLQVDAFVDEVDIGKVMAGQEALFTVDAYPAQDFKGRVSAIYPKAIIQENVVNYDVVLEIEGQGDSLLRPDMTASVTIFLNVRKGLLAVPSKALKRERGASVVYVDGGGTPEAREVKIGWKDGQWVEIAAGLEEGQTIYLEAPKQEESN